MTDLFILGKLRAPYRALTQDIETLAQRLCLEPENGMYVDDVVCIPFGATPHFPGTFQPHLEAAAGELFTDYAIGQLHGYWCCASQTHITDAFAGQLYMYGRNSKLLEKRLNLASRELEVVRELDAQSLQEQQAREREQEWRAEAEADDVDWDDDEEEYGDLFEGNYPYVGGPVNVVEGGFPTVGLVDWLTKYKEEKARGAAARLLLLITRGETSEFLASRDGQKLMTILGPTVSVVMQSDYAACMAFEPGSASHLRWHTLGQVLRPRFVEDFVFLDIGLEIAAKHPTLSRLADWANERTQPTMSTTTPEGPRVLKPTPK